MAKTRKLTAIMAVDVVGYSRLMGDDEAGTARAVREHRDAARPIVAGLGGRIVKTMGDGLLLEFPSVVAAVECAISIQKLMVERNADVPEANRIVYRVGVNLGDVLIEGDDILGDGVNIPARLEGICEPGGVLISGTAYDHVRGRIDADFIDLAEKDLKNIARSVRVFAVKIGSEFAASAPSASEPDKQGRPHLSIVVLPFDNMTRDPQQEYFVDGVTESLTTDLSRISGCLVIGRNTAFTYKGKHVDLRQIGRELNVRYILEGSVQRVGNRMRVSVQLIDAESGNHLWAERFDKPLTDFFDMQDEIVARLANALSAQLVVAEARRAGRTPNPDAVDLCFQGLAWFNEGLRPEYLARAREFYERTLALDPVNVFGLLGVAIVDMSIALNLFSEDRAALLTAAEATLTKVLSVAPENSRAHLLLGTVQMYTGRASQGIRACERALQLDRNLAAAHAHIGKRKFLLGQAEDTEAHVQKALRLSPLDPQVYAWCTFAGMAKFLLGKEEEAAGWLLRSIETNRNQPASHLVLAAVLARLGRLADARSEVQACLTIAPTMTIARVRATSPSDHPNVLAGLERIIDGLRQAGLPE
jgi:TolB-like protein/class 3 adenylate cyclase/Tfp pilus assembly protein PilF